MFKSVTQPFRWCCLSGFSTRQQVRYLDWELKLPPVDPTDYLPKLKPSQRRIPVFQRRFEMPELPKGVEPTDLYLNKYHWVYDKIVDKNQAMLPYPDITIILTKNVTGVGSAGTKLRMKGNRAYRDFLLPKLAVYASPENEEKYKSLFEEIRKKHQFSSVSAEITLIKLQRMMVQLWMNLKNPWMVDKWHIRVAFRMMGVIVPDECIELPSKPITGPDMLKEGKHFFVTVVINNHDHARVVCRLNHFTPDFEEAPSVLPLWTKPFDPLFEEDAEYFQNLKPPKEADTTSPYLDGFKPFTVLTKNEK